MSEGTATSEEPGKLEAALLRRIGEGDEEALAAFYDRLSALAYGLALRVAGDPGLAQDAVQEALLRVWRRADLFDPGRGSARGWFLRIVRNAAIDQTRKESTQQRAVSRASDEPVSSPVESPQDRLAGSESAAQLAAALRALPAEQLRMIQIAYFEGLSHTEIAQREGVPLGTVKSRIRDGVQRLRQAVAEGRLHG